MNLLKHLIALGLLLIVHTNMDAQTCPGTSRNHWEWMGHNNWFLPTAGSPNGGSYIYNQRAGGSATFIQQTDYAAATWANKIRGYQGVAAASDDKGNLKFFCNGRKVWNANGTLVTDKILAGNECGSQEDKTSAVHGTMIVRHPLTPDRYYIITIDDIVNQGSPTVNNQKGTCGNGVTFAAIDSSGNSLHSLTPGGSVPIERDISSGQIGAFRTTEDFSATFHANGVDIWITFHPIWQTHVVSYLLTCDGFVTPPVKSGIGDVPYCSIVEAIGGVDFNFDGSKIAVGVEINLSGPQVDSYSGQGTVNLYDFNNKTAALTQRKAIYHKSNGTQNLYNLIFSSDGNELHYGGSGGSGKYDISSNNEASILAAGNSVSNALNSGNQFNGASMNYQGVIEQRPTTYAKAGVTVPNGIFSSNNMYIPPLEEPDIQEVGPFCDTVSPVDIHTYWLCSGVSAEDSINQTHSYFLLDSNDVKANSPTPGYDPNSAAIIGEKTGVFDPGKATAGTHRIVFIYCGVNDTIDIVVNKCGGCQDTLKQVIPNLCVGDSPLLLDTMVKVASAAGVWTIDSFPGHNAVLTEGMADTLFDASALTTIEGLHKLIFTVTDGSQECKDSMYIKVNKPPLITVNSDTICSGDAAATFTATSDSTVQTYLWADEGSGGNQTTSGTTAGIYTVLVTDNNGCEGRDTGTLVVNALPVIAVNNDTICLGDPDATFTATSDSVVDTYLWADNGSGGAQTTTGSAAGIYTVLVTDENGCTGRDTGTLVVNALPVISVNDSAICAGDPAARFTATSDSVVDTYLWADEGSGALQTTDGTTAGIYTVTVTDVHGCIGRDTGTLVVNALPVISVNDSTICVGDPAAEFTATSDSIVDTYLWGDEGSGSNQTTSGTTAGLYTVTVTDVHGCIGRDTGTLSVNALPVITVNDSTICSDGGPALFTATSDTTAANYVWGDNGAGTDPTTSGTVAGIYTVLVIDKNGCTGRDTGEMFINLVPVVTVNSDTICAGDADATFTATSDTTAASYVWSVNGFGNAPTSTGTTAGDYTVTVTDKNNCVGTGTGVLTVNTLPVITVNDSTICAGGLVSAEFTATSDTTVSGPGSGYVWSSLGTGTLQTTSGTTAGDYTVTVTDKNGCVGTGTGVLKLSALPVLSVNDAEICVGDPGATFTVTSDTAVATYAWSGNGTGTDPTTSGTVAGDYVVNIVDVNGCIGTATGALTVHDLPVVTLDGGNVCPNTPFTLTPVVTTNNPAPTYSWDTGENTPTLQKGAGTYTVTVTDGKGCINTASATVIEDPNLQPIINGPIDLCDGEDTLLISNYKAVDGYDFVWSFGQAPTGDVTESITVNTAGTYGLFVSKGNCQGATTVEVIVNALPTVTVQDLAICDGDPAATFTATSATATSYVWSDNGTGTSPTTSGSVAGDYTVVILDDKGCTATATAALTVNPLPTVTVADNEICSGDPAATFTATSATATGWTWSVNGTGGQQTTTGTTAGDYTVEVSDANGCIATGTGTLTVNALPIVAVNSETICAGDPMVTFTATVDSAVSVYAWSDPGTGSQQTTTGVTAGNYVVNITDVNGCLGNATGVLNVEPTPLVGDLPGTICSGESTTIGEVIPTGGTYTYLWTNTGNNENTAIITVTTGGSYDRTVTSLAGCDTTSTYVVTENDNPTVAVEPETECANDVMTMLDIYPSAGHSYIWNPGNLTGPSINPTVSQIFDVRKINDVTGCFSETTATATFVPIPSADIAPDTVYICQGEGADLFVSTTGASTVWSNGSTLESITVFNEGTYTAVTSNATCTDEDAVYVQVTQYPTSMLNQLLALEPVCFVNMDSALTLTANTNDTLNFMWNTGEETNSIGITEEGTYTVTISSNAGPEGKVCEIDDQITFRDFCPYTFYVPNAFTPNGEGRNERFYAYGTHLLEFEITIYDRWGLKVYESNDLYHGWDGKYLTGDVQQDVYVWKAKFKVATYDGSEEEHSRVGTVTVVR